MSMNTGNQQQLGEKSRSEGKINFFYFEFIWHINKYKGAFYGYWKVFWTVIVKVTL